MIKKFKIEITEKHISVYEHRSSFVSFKFKRTKEITGQDIFEFLIDLAFYELMDQSTIHDLKAYFQRLYPDVLVNWEHAFYVFNKVFRGREFEEPAYSAYRRGY